MSSLSDSKSDDSENERLVLHEKIHALSAISMYEKSIKYFNSERYIKSTNEKHYFHENININFEHMYCDMFKIKMCQSGGADFGVFYPDSRDYTDGKIHYNLQKYHTDFYDLLKVFSDYHDNDEYMLDGKFNYELYDEVIEMYSDKNIDTLMKLLDVTKHWIDNNHDVFLVTFELVNESVTYDYIYKVLNIKQYINHIKWIHSGTENYSKWYIEDRRFDFFKVFIRKKSK